MERGVEREGGRKRDGGGGGVRGGGRGGGGGRRGRHEGGVEEQQGGGGRGKEGGVGREEGRGSCQETLPTQIRPDVGSDLMRLNTPHHTPPHVYWTVGS